MTRTSPPCAPIVLVSGDDRRMRHMLVLALWHDGCRVISASDIAELERWIGRLTLGGADDRCVGLIIADQRMPGSAGLEVLMCLRRLDWSTPFILITSSGDTATLLEARRLGAWCIPDDPFDLEALRAVVARQIP